MPCVNCQASTNVPPGGLTPNDICNGNYITSDCVIYAGVALSTIDIENGDTFTTIVNNINNVIENIITGDFSFTITPTEGLEVNGSSTIVTINEGDDAAFTLLPATSTTQGIVSTVDQVFGGCKTTTIWTATDYFAYPTCNDFLAKQSVTNNNLQLGKNRDKVVSGTFNTLVGTAALSGATLSGTGNTFIGYNSGQSATTGNYNTVIGSDALSSCTIGDRNTAIGFEALKISTTSSAVNNVAIGYQSMVLNTSGNSNTAIGTSTLSVNTTASAAVAVGFEALKANTTGANNTAVGFQALLSNTIGGQNVAFGKEALEFNTIGIDNVAIGYQALGQNISGNANVSVGREALLNNTVSNNVGVGFRALKDNTTGTGNIGIGYQSLFNNTTGNNNVGLGNETLTTNLIGFENTAIGANSLFSATGSQNTAIGYLSLEDLTTGASNTAIGRRAGWTNSTGSFNIFLGVATTFAGGTSRSNCIVIGHNAQATASRQGIIGSSNSDGYITDLYLGSGVASATPFDITVRSTGAASVADTSGANLKFQAGIPTGTGKSGDLVILSSSRSTISSSLPPTTIEAYRHRGSAISTSTATTTIIDSYVTSSNTTITFNVRVVAKGTTTDSAFYNFVATFNNNGGTVTQVGTTTKLVEQETIAGWDIDFNITGTSVETRVISTAMNINWVMSTEIFTV